MRMIATQDKEKTSAEPIRDMTAVLNRQIANWNILYTKLHRFHWFVKGPQFFTLHSKFEQLYEEAATYIDELAERVLAIGGRPLATMREYLAEASVKEAEGDHTGTEMAAMIVKDFETVISELKSGLKTARQAQDEPTSDILIGMQKSLEKHVWMLKAFNG